MESNHDTLTFGARYCCCCFGLPGWHIDVDSLFSFLLLLSVQCIPPLSLRGECKIMSEKGLAGFSNLTSFLYVSIPSILAPANRLS